MLASNLISLSVYLAGIYLFYLVCPWLALLFLALIIYLELSIYREGCVNCYYYGKLCASGRGKIAGLFFKKGNPKKFCEKSVNFKDFVIPSLANILPLIAGIYLLIKDFRWLVLIIMIWPILMLFFGNPIIFGELACPNCKQARICCPVCEFFKKRAEAKQKR